MQKKILLSPRFSFEELTFTSQNSFLKQNQILAKEYLFELTLLANYILEPARALLNTPLIITSGFRCIALNNAVGGGCNSQHLKGQAADFVPREMDINKAYQILKESKLINYGQLILEKGWLHISLGAPFRSLAASRQAFKL